mmetsp:Transcript_49172/g.107192  ORF Transcript_49172/g.107192 Transcript_49172/m.107192 type:complete len:233 (+) Transcript_49172:94-792(+)
MRPLNQFCCGCSLNFGVKLIVFLHLMVAFLVLGSVVSNVVFQFPVVGFNVNLVTQTLDACWCLLGLPFILAAMWGVSYRLETHVRIYMYYLALTFMIDFGIIMFYVAVQDTCTMLPSTMKAKGSAFACGSLRLVTVAIVSVIVVAEAYCVFAVWSLAEDIRGGGAGFGFSDLSSSKGSRPKTYADGVFGTAETVRGPYPVSYGSIAAQGVGGSSQIFGGTYHEVAYPPPPNF